MKMRVILKHYIVTWNRRRFLIAEIFDALKEYCKQSYVVKVYLSFPIIVQKRNNLIL